MIGGQPNDLADERLYRFEFPERPGALLRFLRAVGTTWNVSLFHYRNHGSDNGRVLAGIQVPPETQDDFLRHLNDLHYEYTDETDNPSYKIFLGG
jgi:threonine dehydratase